MSAVRDHMAATLGVPAAPAVTAMAAALAAHFGPASRAVLFYGSCLREATFDGLMLDFYLIVSDYEAAFGPGWQARANRWLPPNVYPFGHDGLMSKVAVLSEADFARLCSPAARDVSVFARFAQPTRLVWSADAVAGARAVDAVAQAPATLAGHALPLIPDSDRDDGLALWRVGFANTYAAELRAERKTRSGSIVDADPDWYRDLTAALRTDRPDLFAARPDAVAGEAQWARFRRRGKLLSVLRLAKASTTFTDGIDYLAWKVNRHAGTAITVTPWQRRHPILAAFVLVPRLWRSGAIR